MRRKLKICKIEDTADYDISADLIGIYLWINKINNKIYVGSSTFLSKRLRSHILKSSNKDLRKDIHKYGITNFTMSILEFIEFKENIIELKKYILEREQYYLDTLCKANEPNKGFSKLSYNKNRKADSPLGYKHSVESRKKLSDASKNKVLSDLHKQNISINHSSKQSGYIHHTKIYGVTNKQKESIKIISENNKKPILQYDCKGYFIKEWSSTVEASKALNIDCGNICNNISKKDILVNLFILEKKLMTIQ